jgi:hypothetical protein
MKTAAFWSCLKRWASRFFELLVKSCEPTDDGSGNYWWLDYGSY